MGHAKAVDAAQHSRDGIRPSFCIVVPSSRTEGAGKAGWPLHPGPSRRKDLRERENHRYGGDHTGLPCAVVYGLYALSSVNHPVCHRRRRDAQASSPTWRQTLGRQDHTISPSAKSAARQSAPSRPPHLRLTCRDDRDTSLCKRGGTPEEVRLICPTVQAARLRHINATGKIGSCRSFSVGQALLADAFQDPWPERVSRISLDVAVSKRIWCRSTDPVLPVAAGRRILRGRAPKPDRSRSPRRSRCCRNSHPCHKY